MALNSSVTLIYGVGDSLAKKFAVLGIKTVGDLINNIPRRYIDYSNLITISKIRPGVVTLRVKLSLVKSRYSKRGLHLTEARATDLTGSVKIIWFNQPYRSGSINPNDEYYISGEFAKNYKYLAITNPACEKVSNFPVNTARIVPVYRLTKGLGLAQFRKTVKNALKGYKIAETLPKWIIEQHQLISKSDAINQMHFPESIPKLQLAKKRLGFEEVFELTLASELNKEANRGLKAIKISFNELLIKKFVAELPFKLTNDQRKSAWQIFQDLESGIPMNRLLEGDVGSGKTVVAVLSALGAISAGYQVAFMAPTELLAIQHAESIHRMLESTAFSKSIILLTGSIGKKQKDLAKLAIASGDAKLIIGTHAIFQKNVSFNKLGLVIVDEQHRFGVEQRKKLQSKTKLLAHILSMTATPIPRSLALTLYGELDISLIDQLPPGRKRVTTKVTIPENRNKIYQEICKELTIGRQAFVVCPHIDSENVNSRLSVKNVFTELSKTWLRKYRVGLLHSRMKSDLKNKVMEDFVKGTIDVLVSTTVIEVGVDIPNASVMVVEGADMFGLAQLHQLRGRVGRGPDSSSCYLVLSDNDKSTQRLKLLEREQSGFKLAEYDLELRGPGAIYGTMQHGVLDLRVAKLSDFELISTARATAKEFIKKSENLLQYPQLKDRVESLRMISNLN